MLNAVVLLSFIAAGFVLMVMPLLQGRGSMDPFSEVEERTALHSAQPHKESTKGEEGSG